MKTNEKGLTLIKHFESLHDGDLTQIGCQPKMDPVGIWTIGWGHALWNSSKNEWYRGVKDKAVVYALYPGMSREAADLMLLHDIISYEQAVLKMIGRRDLSDDQFSALVSFCYNCGTTYKNAVGISRPFKLWSLVDRGVSGSELYNYWKDSVITSGGRVLPGLIRRRKAEAILYNTGQLDFFEHTA